MLLLEDLSHLIPRTHGKILGIASFRGDVIVACEYGVMRIFDDGMGVRSEAVLVTPETGKLLCLSD